MSGFRRTGDRIVHAWQHFALVEADFEGPEGRAFQRTYLHHPGAVGVVAVDGDDAVLVRQYRPALDRELLEIAAGTLDRTGELPLACAERELREEVGARAGSLVFLVSYVVAAGVSDEQLHLFLATDLTFGAREADGIEEEAMTVVRLPLADVDAAVADGTIADAKTILGLLLARRRLGGQPTSPSSR